MPVVTELPILRFALGKVVAVAMATLVAPALAPWEWALDARVQARTELIAEGLARRPEYRIEGRTHPEVFLPCEAYEHFIRRAYELAPKYAQRHRAEMAEGAGALALPEDFWTVAQEMAAELIALHREERRLAWRLAAANDATRLSLVTQIEALQRSSCAARRDALAATRAVVGTTLFDRFLYEVVVPGMYVRGSRLEEPRCSALR